MYELIIMLSRYLFVFYAIYFLTQTFLYILDELKGKNKNIERISKQRIAIVFIHLTSFLILSYIPNTYRFDMTGLLFGLGSLILYSICYFLINKLYKHSCKLIWNCIFFIFDIGLIMIYRLNKDLAMRQLLWFSIGFFLLLLVPLFFRFLNILQRLSLLYYILALILIMSPFFLGQEQHGAIRSIILFGHNLQPTEIVKFLYVFFLASIFRKGLNLKRLIFSTSSGVFILTLVIKTDLGSSLIFFITYFVIVYVISGSKFLLFGGIILGYIGAIIGYTLFGHVQVRVDIWRNPWIDPAGRGFQIIQSLFAIGTWGLLGSGLTRGYPETIPVVVSDFIFSAITEEFGVIFAVCLICVFMMLIFKCIVIALECKDVFTTILVVSFTSMFSIQTFLILGGVTKLIPLTGVTMPFVSYGGSSVIVSLITIGIIQCCAINNKKENTEVSV